MFIKPKSLHPGDTIGVVAPAGPVLQERLDLGVQYLRQRGYKVRVAEHAKDRDGYLAGSDTDRAADVNAMFRDPDVSAIFCVRGGYGSPRILDKLDYDLIHQNPKILVGYSDITALQLALLAKSKLISFSGPMVAVEMATRIKAPSERHLWELLTGSIESRVMAGEKRPLSCLKPGRARGTLIGGCLSLVCALIGTPYLPDFTGAILVLEEVGEEPYRVDRSLTHLRLAGIMDKLSGIVFGEFSNCTAANPADSWTLEKTIRDRTSDLRVPILTGLPYGHVASRYSIPFGAEAVLDADEGSLKIDQAVTS